MLNKFIIKCYFSDGIKYVVKDNDSFHFIPDKKYVFEYLGVEAFECIQDVKKHLANSGYEDVKIEKEKI